MNKAILMGRLTKDPDLRTTASGKTYTLFTLAVDRKAKKDAPQGTPTADFIMCKAWEKTADVITKYCRKGSRVLIEGRIETRTYDVNGQKRYATEVLVMNMEFADSKRQDAGADEWGAPVSDGGIAF